MDLAFIIPDSIKFYKDLLHKEISSLTADLNEINNLDDNVAGEIKIYADMKEKFSKRIRTLTKHLKGLTNLFIKRAKDMKKPCKYTCNSGKLKKECLNKTIRFHGTQSEN